MSNEITIALIGLLGVAVTSAGAIMSAVVSRRKLDQAEREIRFQRAALAFPDFVSEWSEINKELEDLVTTTEIDRILLLRAWNGHLEPRWTTAVYQMRAAGQAPISYIHYELDNDYQAKVREIVQNGLVSIVTAEMSDCEIKRVYEAEGVTASLWAHLDSFTTADGSGKAIAYCSFSTHEPTLISEVTATKCRILVGRLKGLAQSFDRNDASISNLRPAG